MPCSQIKHGTDKTHKGEQGSALLVVMVFAAIVAIMLYRALPDVYFEAQRQKEQLLMDRGNEYKMAIKRFYAKNRTFPTSIDQLDNFNNVRYLRHHYKDPMTGKQEWRLIHVMGPGFVLTDSKVTPLNANAKNKAQAGGGFGVNNSNGSGGLNSSGPSNTAPNSQGGQTATDTFDNSSFGQSGGFGQGQSNENGEPQSAAAEIYGAHRRPPARPLPAQMPPEFAQQQSGPDSGGVQEGSPPLGAENPTELPPDSAEGNPNGPQSNVPQPNGFQQPNGIQQPNGVQEGVRPGSQAPQGVDNSLPPNADPNNPASSGLKAVNAALRREQTVPVQQSNNSSFGQSTFGNIPSGAIAGVASTGKGNSIKIMEKQTDYSKWEFVYNPEQEAASKMQGALNGTGNGQSSGTNSSFGGSSPVGGFGPSKSVGTSTSTGFGNSSSFGSSSSSSFGNASSSGFGSTSAPTTSAPSQSQ